MMTATRRLLACALVAGVLATPAVAQQRRADERWVATWATALVARPLPVAAPPSPPATSAAPAAPPAPPRPPGPPPATVTDQTLRQIVRISIGGDSARVVLSNAFGSAPIAIGAADVALRDKDSRIVAASVKTLTFGGHATASILPGATLVSDPVTIELEPLTDLVVDLYVPGELGISASPVTTHNGASQTNYLSSRGDHTGQSFEPTSQAGAWFLLSRVEVAATPGTLAVVTFGDSITDGARSTSDANNRWPDQLARRLAARKGAPVAVLNAGISGNRVLGDGAGLSALARFDKDALMQTGVTHVVVMEGINDIGLGRSDPSPSADDLIAGHKQLIARARARGLKVFGATLTPFDGAFYFTPEGEAKRQAVNAWIRTGGAYDGVIDFDELTRDPGAPSKFAPAFDSGDHLHPNDAGYKAMGDTVDSKLFRK